MNPGLYISRTKHNSVRQASRQERIFENYFSYFAIKTYVMGTQKNHLNEMVLLSTQNKCSNWSIRNNSQFYTKIFHLPGSIMVILTVSQGPWWHLWTQLCSPKSNIQRDGSLEHPKQFFKLMDKKLFTILCSKIKFIWTFSDTHCATGSLVTSLDTGM